MNTTSPGAPKVTTFHTPITVWGVTCPFTLDAYGKNRRPPSAPARIAVGRITEAAGPLSRWLAWLQGWCSGDSGPAASVILPTAILAGALGGLLFLPYASSVNGQVTPHTVIGVWKVVTFGAP